MRPHRLLPAAIAAALVGLLASACAGRYVVEDRDTPVHVWLEAPAAAAGDVATHLLLYVGDRKVMDGPIRFPAGRPRVELPTVYMPAGERPVSVVVGGGQAAARGTAKIRHATWILVTIRGTAADISVSYKEPDEPR